MMGAQEWAWVLLIVGLIPIGVTWVRLGRVRDPRDAVGRKVAVDAEAVRRAERQHGWGVAIWGAFVLGSFALRVVGDRELLAPSGVALGLLAIGVAVTMLLRRRRRIRADAAARSSEAMRNP